MVLVFERTLQQLQDEESGRDATEALHVQLLKSDETQQGALTFSEASRQALPLESGPAARLAIRAPALGWELGYSETTHAILQAEVIYIYIYIYT